MRLNLLASRSLMQRQEPARLPAVAAVRQFGGVEQFLLQRRNHFVVTAGADCNAGRLQPRHAFIEALLGAGGGIVPAAGSSTARLRGLLAAGALSGPCKPGVPASPPTRADDLMGDLPGLFQRRAEDAGAALALIIVAALAVERVDARLETKRQPQKLAGRMVEPITWVPSAALTMPVATDAAEPLDEPPGVCATFHGLRVPRGSDAANSVVTVLPTMTAPASTQRAHAG